MRGIAILAAVLAVMLGAGTAAFGAQPRQGSTTTTTSTSTTPAPPPANDNRDNATDVGSLPATENGTTAGATVEQVEPPDCDTSAGSVWYSVSFDKNPPPKVGVALQANGKLDANIAVFHAVRSQDQVVRCDDTDKHGRAGLTFKPQANQGYLIRVQQLANSAPGTFNLQVLDEPAPPQLPGAALPKGGGHGVLNSVLNPSAGYSAVLQAATTYRINLVNRNAGCTRVAIYAPKTTSYDEPPLSEHCAGYRLFTPRHSGRYSFLVKADPSQAEDQPYAFNVAPATRSEMAPGIALPNLRTVTGALRGNAITDLRLYSFDVTKRSNLALTLKHSGGSFNVELLSYGGRELASDDSGSLETITKPGRYYAVVQAQSFSWGKYSLTRQSRAVTSVRTLVNGRGKAGSAPGQRVTFSAHVPGAEGGRVAFQLEYFDPVSGWQYRGTFTEPVNRGVAVFPYTPGVTGHWRAKARYSGSRTAAPSKGFWAELTDAGPLTN
ncbi:MAG: PPC domain-containing protein [Solirubrobacterales bacterium]|nr:PPC domain-containing protein [Solirubrobacterales bacterium]